MIVGDGLSKGDSVPEHSALRDFTWDLKADRGKRFHMEELRANLSSFLEELDKRSQALGAISEARCGTSHTVNDVAGRFNNSVRNFIQEMLDELQATVDKNKIMSESKDNINRNAEIYRESFNTLARVTDGLMKQFAQLQANSARISAIANSHIRETQMLRVQVRQLEKKIADLGESNRILKERELAMLTTMRGQIAANQVIAGTNSVFAQLAENMKEGTASMAEVDALKAKVDDLTSENELLTAKCDIQKSRMDELKEEVEQLRKDKEEADKMLQEKEEEVKNAQEMKTKFVGACAKWKGIATDRSLQIQELKQQIEEKDTELKELAEQHEAELEAIKELYAARAAVTNPDDGTNRHEHHDAPDIDELIIPEDHKMGADNPPSPEEGTAPEEEEKPDM